MDCECLTEFCEVRAMILPISLRKQCAAGHVEGVTAMIQQIQDRRQRRAKDRPEVVKPSPPVSTVGTRIRYAIEIATKTQITCGGCLVYLRGLDRVKDHDIDTVTNGLLAQLALPVEFRKQLGGIPAQRVWLRVIVQRAIVESIVTAQSPVQ